MPERTFDELAALVPDAHVEPTCSGELVIYTGLRLDERNMDGPLVPFECPSCCGEDQADNEQDCDDDWHLPEPVGGEADVRSPS